MAIKRRVIPRFDDHERFLKFISVKGDTDCWEWSGSINKKGYGQFILYDGNKYSLFLSHRISYSIFVGFKDESMAIDHICRNRKCCNPDHLHEVTDKENSILNSIGVSAKNKNKETCKYGHKFDLVRMQKAKNGSINEKRDCSICSKRRSRKQWDKIKNANKP